MTQNSTSNIDRLLYEQLTKLSEDQKKSVLAFVNDLIDEGRRYNRNKFLAGIDYRSTDRFASGFIQNISVGGLYIKPSEPFKVGKKVTLSFKHPVSGKLIHVNGTVAWRNQWGLGVEFNEKIYDID
ncbi:MAG: PilZ domain-containing protein [Deltaproteobacteria bacterium]|nr:PilZ domain-containing protein [Deltaproteobacteria bacterium]